MLKTFIPFVLFMVLSISLLYSIGYLFAFANPNEQWWAGPTFLLCVFGSVFSAFFSFFFLMEMLVKYLNNE